MYGSIDVLACCSWWPLLMTLQIWQVNPTTKPKTYTWFYQQCLVEEQLQVVVHHLLLLHLEQLAPEEVPVGSMLPQCLIVGDGVAALLDEQSELLLVEAHLVGEQQLRLHARLDHVPEGLDRVELW